MSEAQDVGQVLERTLKSESTAQAYFESLTEDVGVSADHEQFKSMAGQAIRHQRLVSNLLSMINTTKQ
jgi:hypothetical protein